jgi:hypothetical protein
MTIGIDRNAPMPSTGLQSGTNALPQDLGGRELGCDTERRTLWSRKCVISGGNSEILSVFLAIGSARQKSRKKKGYVPPFPLVRTPRPHCQAGLSQRLAVWPDYWSGLKACVWKVTFFPDFSPTGGLVGGRETLKEIHPKSRFNASETMKRIISTTDYILK